MNRVGRPSKNTVLLISLIVGTPAVLFLGYLLREIGAVIALLVTFAFSFWWRLAPCSRCGARPGSLKETRGLSLLNPCHRCKELGNERHR